MCVYVCVEGGGVWVCPCVLRAHSDVFVEGEGVFFGAHFVMCSVDSLV